MSLMLVPYSVSTVFRCTFEAVGRPWLGVAFAAVSLGLKVPLNALALKATSTSTATQPASTLRRLSNAHPPSR